MSSAEPPKKSPRGAAFGQAFQIGWSRLTADDQHEPDLDRLAAWADGRLAPADEAALSRELAESPASLEVLAALLADQPQRRFPSSEPTAAQAPVAPPATVTRPPTPPARQRRNRQLAVWATAASLLVAAWVGLRSVGLQNQVASLSRRQNEMATTLVASQRQQLAQVKGAGRPYLLGATSAAIDDPALAAFAEEMRGGARAAGPLSVDQQEALHLAQGELVQAAEYFDLDSLTGKLEYAAALIDAGRFDDAKSQLDAVKQEAAASSATLAQWENLRGGLYARQAARMPAGQSAPVWEQAEALFQSAEDHGWHDALFNLAQLYLARGDRTAALDAAREYLTGVTDPQRREILEELLVP